MIPTTQQTVIASALLSPGRLLLLTRTTPAGRWRLPCYRILRTDIHGRREEIAEAGCLFPRAVFWLFVGNLRRV